VDDDYDVDWEGEDDPDSTLTTICVGESGIPVSASVVAPSGSAVVPSEALTIIIRSQLLK
jgi:hypothetical protein